MKLTGLWPRMPQAQSSKDGWMKRFRVLDFKATSYALDSHWEDHSQAFAPDPKAVVKLAKQFNYEHLSPEQLAERERFYDANKLEQARTLRDSWQKLRDKRPIR